jgi:hypothetical protein
MNRVSYVVYAAAIGVGAITGSLVPIIITKRESDRKKNEAKSEITKTQIINIHKKVFYKNLIHVYPELIVPTLSPSKTTRILTTGNFACLEKKGYTFDQYQSSNPDGILPSHTQYQNYYIQSPHDEKLDIEKLFKEDCQKCNVYSQLTTIISEDYEHDYVTATEVKSWE